MRSYRSLFVSFLVATFPVEAAMRVELTSRAVTVSGFPAGNSVALVSVARERAYYMASVESRQKVLLDQGRAGTVAFEPKGGVSPASIWIAVDLGSGQSAIAAPEGFRLIELQGRGASRGKAVAAIAGTLEIDRTAVDILVVRPAAGAWFVTARDGNEADRDGVVNGKLRLDPARLRPLHGTAEPPRNLERGDVVVLLDAERMEYWLHTVGGEQQ